jgi:hypothetical protein
MFFQFSAPQRLKGATASVQGILLCKVGIITPQVAPLDPVGYNTSIIFHKSKHLSLLLNIFL